MTFLKSRYGSLDAAIKAQQEYVALQKRMGVSIEDFGVDWRDMREVG